MDVIVKANGTISNLWGRQEIEPDNAYRLMRYVVKVDYKGETLLHNVVTGKLIILSSEEALVVNALPLPYRSVMDMLVTDHYLVPVDYDEHKQVVNLRHILRKLYRSKHQFVIQYTILPTTACNARCYYCFEQGSKIVSMTEQTADELVDFIDSHCGQEKKITIQWFGGEPTVGANRIDQICNGLVKKGINYTSTMISNAYLFDEEMVEKAKHLWNLKSVQITLDGTEERYNRTKAYVNVQGSPYQRVLRNVGLLLDQEIRVRLRLNFDKINYLEFEEILDEIRKRFGNSRFLTFYAYPVIDEYSNLKGRISQGSKKWIADTTVQLNNKAREFGLYKKEELLPHLRYIGCGADMDSAITITPEGLLVKCAEQFSTDQMIGDVKNGFIDNKVFRSWRILSDYPECIRCSFFPRCVRLYNCSAKDHCYFSDRNHLFIETIKQQFDLWSENQTKGGNNET